MGGLAGGLIGAGLFGLLAGNGMFGGLGSIMGFLGLLLQIAIVFFIARFAVNYFRRRQALPAPAGASMNFSRQPPQPDWRPSQGSATPAPTPRMPELTVAEADFDAFERLLGEIQEAYGKGDRISLTQRVTPQMANIFNEELSELASGRVVEGDPKRAQEVTELWTFIRQPGGADGGWKPSAIQQA